MPHLWPNDPLVPDDWAADEAAHHPHVVAAMAEGFCPKHLVQFGADSMCTPCGARWEFVSAAGTAPTCIAAPPFAVTDGHTVLVSRYL
jgi:hypothetical protein